MILLSFREPGQDDNIPLYYVNNFKAFAGEYFEEDKLRKDKTPQIAEMDKLIGEARRLSSIKANVSTAGFMNIKII